METEKKLKPTKKTPELRHQYLFDSVKLGEGEEEQTFKVLKVKSPEEWPAASEYKTSHPFSLPGSNSVIKIPLQGISFGQWLEMESRLPMPPDYQETGVESEAELELKKKEARDEQDRIESIRRVEIFENCTQKKIPGETIEEKVEYLQGFGTAEIESLLSYILDKFSITPIDSIYLSTFNELLRKKRTFVEFNSFDDWKSLSSLGYTIRIHRPFEDYITEFNLRQISDKQKKEIESKTKMPRVPSRPSINKKTGEVDPNNPIQDFDNPTWKKNVKQVQKVRTLMMFEHCLPFEIPGKNEEERYNWIGDRLLGDVLKLKNFIETEVYSYRAQYDFYKQLAPEGLKDYKHFEGKHKIKDLKISEQYSLVACAKEWGLKPWEFRELAPDKQAELVAFYTVEKQIKAYYSSETAKIQDRITKTPTGNSAPRRRGRGRR